MKQLILTIALVAITAAGAFAQKTSYVDSQYILDRMPAYKAAKKEVDQISENWQADLEKKYKVIEEKYKAYQEEEVLLPEEVKKQRQEEIFELERQAKEYKKEKFGYDGELYRVQDENIRPVQDQVYQAIESVAKEKKLNMVLDRSGNAGIIYADPTFDITKAVMNKLGIKDE